MQNTLLRKGIAFIIIFLFVGVSVIPSTRTIVEKNSYILIFNEGSLSGFINDTSMNPIDGARVRVYFHGTYEEDFTDSLGYYSVTNIPICNCTKKCTAFREGYKPECVWLSIYKNTTYNFILTPGKTLYVGGSGDGNYTSIQDAIDNASDGDTVFVYDDSSPYYEDFVINKSISLIGEDRDTTSIIGDNYNIFQTILVRAENVNVKNLNIKREEFGYCIVLENGSSTISSCKINSNPGIRIEGSGHNTLTNNSFRHGGDIYTKSDNNTIENNEFIKSSLSIVSSNNTVSSNTFSKDGFSIGGSSNPKNNVFSGNILFDCVVGLRSSNNYLINNSFYDGGISVYCGGNVLINNTLNDKPIGCLDGKTDMVLAGGEYGQIIITDCDNITITKQNISKNTLPAIQLFNCGNCSIVDNDFIEVWIHSTNYTVISNNKFIDRGYGVYLDEYSNYNNISNNFLKSCGIFGICVWGGGSYNKIINNTVVNCGWFFPLHQMFNSFGGIIIESYLDTVAKGNIISCNLVKSNKNVGISLNSGPFLRTPYVGPTDTIVIGNTITGNLRGISLLNAHNNNISKNNITGNIDGIELFTSNNNIIFANNIQNNIRQASFAGSRSNSWKCNYWGRTLWRPKIITGRIGFLFYFIPWFNIDWHPAKEPYDIDV